MFANNLNTVKAQSGPIGRMIAFYLQAISYRSVPDRSARMSDAILPEIPPVMVSQVGAKKSGNLPRN
jgi:hypothetical protein